SCVDFPKLTEADLRYIILGSYQRRMAESYVKEHMAGTGKYEFQVCNDNDMPGLLRVNVQSRHKRKTAYKVYIRYEPNGEGCDGINGYMCRCKVGTRTVGTCSHVASVLWYLGCARHNGWTPSNSSLMEIFEPSDV